jgi:23S rRNA (guanine745-N1)-methyltransferase
MNLPQAIIECPLCKAPLEFYASPNKHWRCEQKHSFDSAKQGYTYLLPVQYKKSKSPGDDKMMVAARHHFLTRGFYQQVSDQCNQLLIKYFQQQSITQATIVDAGCGEGYYTNRLQQALQKNQLSADITGIDISKFAVATAAKSNKAIRWFVANSSRLPIADRSAQAILSLFSPLPAAEFYRALDSNGVLLVASTGEQHLIELREKLYDNVKSNAFNPAQSITSHFTPIEQSLNNNELSQSSLKYLIELNDNNAIKDLFAMTPHYWRVSPDRKAQLDTIEHLTVSIDIQLQLFKPKADINT